MPFGFGLGWAQGRMCYMECILAPPGKYDSAVRVRWRCGLFVKLLCPRVILNLYFWHYTFYRTAETTCTTVLICTLPGAVWNAYWRHLANTTQPSVYGGDAAFSSNYFVHVLYLPVLLALYILPYCRNYPYYCSYLHASWCCTVPVWVYARVLYFYRFSSRHATDWASDLRSKGHDFDCRSWRGCVCAYITKQCNVVAVMNGDALRPER